MSDPGYTDPYRNDGSRRTGGFWPWLTAALTALGFLIGVLIGFNWGAYYEKNALLSPPATTGLAPAPQRPTHPGQ